MPKTRIVIADDNRLSRDCLAAQLPSQEFDIGYAWDLPSLFSQVDDNKTNIILLNVETKDSETMLQVALDLRPRMRVIVLGLSPEDESQIVACADAGVAGLHLRSESFDHLLNLIRNAVNGPAQCSAQVSAILLRQVYAAANHSESRVNSETLTAREREILRLLEQGLTNKQIASRMSVTLHTVKNHVHGVLTKLGVGSRTEAAAVARTMRFSTVGSTEPNRSRSAPVIRT